MISLFIAVSEQGRSCPGAERLGQPPASVSRARLTLLIQKSLLLILVFMIKGRGGENKFAGDTELGGVAEISDSCAAFQRDLYGLEEWTNRNCMKFSKGKCTVLSLEMNNLKHQYMLGNDGLESSPVEMDLEILVHSKLTMDHQTSWQRRLKAS
ncbi:hypothetical protein BTVI_145507 [Pitangus sulphuratus]|nr:hypothetical protein BTVI_145507 [Pitangus sulphuratus]